MRALHGTFVRKLQTPLDAEAKRGNAGFVVIMARSSLGDGSVLCVYHCVFVAVVDFGVCRESMKSCFPEIKRGEKRGGGREKEKRGETRRGEKEREKG